MQKILIIEDEQVIRDSVMELLTRNNYVCDAAASLEQCLKDFKPADYQLILSDLRLPGAPGIDILKHSGSVPVVIMTAFSSVQSAVDAMQKGAKDYITKPFDHQELLRTIRRHILSQNNAWTQPDAESGKIAELIGHSHEMLKLQERIIKAAATDTTVLVLGESGTGKEIVARALHNRSPRQQMPFVTFSCASIPQNSIEAELFGDADHPGLLADAQGGTLFLDEIAELTETAQARLLSILQQDSSGSAFDIRIIAATHRDLRNMVQQNRFRSDLYFRLKVIELVLPPLRERGEDLIELAHHFLQRYSQRHQKSGLSFSEDAINSLTQYSWPGNVRELANLIESAVIMSDNPLISAQTLAIDSHMQQEKPLDTIPENLSLEEYFRYFVLEHQDRMTETELARKLGISRKALWERRQRFELPRPKKGAS